MRNKVEQSLRVLSSCLDFVIVVMTR